MNDIGRKGLFCIALLLFILTGSGIADASTYPGEDLQLDLENGGASPADTEDSRQLVLEQPEIGGTVMYHGSESAFSVFYNPVLLGYALGVVIVLSVGYCFIRTYRRKDAP